MMICGMMVANAPLWTVASEQTDAVLRELMRCSRMSSDYFYEDHPGLLPFKRNKCFECDRTLFDHSEFCGTYCENSFWMSPTAAKELERLRSQ